LDISGDLVQVMGTGAGDGDISQKSLKSLCCGVAICNKASMDIDDNGENSRIRTASSISCMVKTLIL
jgi:hypothetical protein